MGFCNAVVLCESNVSIQKKILEHLSSFDMIALPGIDGLIGHGHDSWRDFIAQQLLLLHKAHGVTRAVLAVDPAKIAKGLGFLSNLIDSYELPICAETLIVPQGHVFCGEVRFECSDFRIQRSRVRKMSEISCRRVVTPGGIGMFESHPQLANEVLSVLAECGVRRVGLRTHDDCARFPSHGVSEHIGNMRMIATCIAEKYPQLEISLGHTRIEHLDFDRYETHVIHPE